MFARGAGIESKEVTDNGHESKEGRACGAGVRGPAALDAQLDFKLAGRPVQVHSFASQGFAYSNQNNYLTMNTSRGAFSLTDFGANVSMSVTDRLRMSAQLYSYNAGELGNYRAQPDWAVADYRFKDWFGVRGGKIKTALGLFKIGRAHV